MMALLLLAAITFHADFEGGSLGKVDVVSPGQYRCHVLGEVDQDGRNRQASWYFFRIDGANGQALTLELVDLPGEYNYKPNQGAIIAGTRPWVSEDGKAWRVLESAEFDAEAPLWRLRLTPAADSIWVAHQPPHTTQDLGRLLRTSGLEWKSVGRTPGGRDIPLVTIGSGPRVVWLLFRQHAWEAGSSWAAEGAIRYLLSEVGRPWRDRVMFKILPMCDPDGVARGGVRFNARGYDLNRNWDTANPALTPEIAAERKAILAWVDSGRRIDLLVTLHNDEMPEYLEGPPGNEHLTVIRKFEANLNQSGVFAATKPAALGVGGSAKGRMTVVEGLYNDRRIAACLIEARTVEHPKLGRQPNAADRMQFGADLARAAGAAVE
jgi:hypothetical protein